MSTSALTDEIFRDVIFKGEGASRMLWEVATRCDCYSDDTRQPEWGCLTCSGFGVTYAAPVEVRGLFRSQARWTSRQMSGEHGLGEASLTLPLDVKPNFVDERFRDRFTIIPATGDADQGRVFYPAADPVPFLFDNVQRAWRVQVQSLQQDTRLIPQP